MINSLSWLRSTYRLLDQHWLNRWEFMHIWTMIIHTCMNSHLFIAMINVDHTDDVLIVAMKDNWSCMKILFIASYHEPYDVGLDPMQLRLGNWCELTIQTQSTASRHQLQWLRLNSHLWLTLDSISSSLQVWLLARVTNAFVGLQSCILVITTTLSVF